MRTLARHRIPWFAALLLACADDSTNAAEGSTADDASTTSGSTAAMSTTDAAIPTDSSNASTSSSGGIETTTSADASSSSSNATDSSSTSTDTDASDSDSSTTGPLECTVHEVLDTIPMLAQAALVDDQGFEGSCAVAGSPEAVFTFTAPADGLYRFDAHTIHSPANALLYVLDDECGGEELGCASATGQGIPDAARENLDLSAGQTVTLVAESNGLEEPWQPIDEIQVAVMGEEACPAGDLGSTVPQTIQGSLATMPDAYVPACDPASAAHDAGFLFTAPADGGYRFTAENAIYDYSELSTFATTPDCGGEQIACATGNGVESPPLSLRMQAGDTAAVFVTGYTSYPDIHFTLDVEAVDMPECPLADIASALPQTVSSSTLDAGNDHAPSCGGSVGADAELSFTASSDGAHVFAIGPSAMSPVVAVLDGTCGGPELGCHDPDEFASEAGLVVDLVSGQAVTVVVDDNNGAVGDFDLFVEQQQGDCVDEDLGTLVPPFDVVGSTAGATNSSAGSCAGLRAPDYGFAWTAPAAGDYAFSTIGSAYSSTISIRDASCDGSELACSRGYDFGNSGAVANASLAANQTVVIAVEGLFVAAGDFVLHVEAQQPVGNCCASHLGEGCSNDLIEACVCDNVDGCCTYWDATCVEIVSHGCGTDCA